jgi:rubrerythrin
MKMADEYISKEPMIEEMRKLIDSVAVNFPNATETELIILKGKYEAFIEYIQEQPAADVQPIKHGRWIGITEYCKKNGYIPSGMGIYYWCSECGKEEKKTSDYCPNCGARMDGEQNERIVR